MLVDADGFLQTPALITSLQPKYGNRAAVCCYGTDESITVTIISPTFHFTLRHHPRLLHRTSLVVVVVVVVAAVGDHNIPAGVWQCRLSLVAGVNRVMELAGSVRCW